LKKLFVILLAVAMILSVSVLASAATFSPYVGGEFQLTYVGANGTSTAPFTLNSGGNGLMGNSMMKFYAAGEVKDEDTNTWAKIGAKLTCWNRTATVSYDDDQATVGTFEQSISTWDLLYSAGIKKVGGIMDIQFSTDDYETTLRGQTPLYRDGIAKFGGDPFFVNRLNNAFGFDVNTDNVTVNIGTDAGVAGVNELGKRIVAAGTFKFDAGKAYVGYAKLSDTNSNMIVGAEMKLGFGTLKADYYMVNTGTSTSAFQANVSLDEMKLAATLLYDMKQALSATEDTIGVGVEYSGIEKFTLGVKYFTTKPDAGMEVYGVYKYGIFDIRPGYAKMGAADGVFYLALHAGMW